MFSKMSKEFTARKIILRALKKFKKMFQILVGPNEPIMLKSLKISIQIIS